MSFAEKLNKGSFVVTSEIGPPKGTEIEKMLENRMPAKLPEDFIPLDELTDEVAEKVGAAEEDEEELKYGWATFCRNEDGLKCGALEPCSKEA